MVIREYLAEDFGFDDSLLKTLGTGKQACSNLDADWGSIQILVFPVGTEMPANKVPSAGISSTKAADQPIQAPATAPEKP
jgi:hypothetical protein